MNRDGPLPGTPGALAECYDVALLDLDGVVYVGPDAIPGVVPSLAAAGRLGMRSAFVTNNASRTPLMVAEHLRRLGVEAGPEQVVTSAQAAASLLAAMLPSGAAVLLIGALGLQVALEEVGLVPVRSAAGSPDAVASGFNPDITWHDLAEACYAVQDGLPWVASNADLTLPTKRGLAPGNGTLVQVVASVTGRRPVVAGKPEPPMHAEAVRRTGARQPLVVGDRLDTDIAGAVNADVPSLLVLSGVTDAVGAVLAPAEHRPTFLAADLSGLLEAHPDVVVQRDESWRCRDAVVTARPSEAGPGARPELRVLEVGHDRLDVVRAACAAVWSGAQELTRGDVEEALRRVLA